MSGGGIVSTNAAVMATQVGIDCMPVDELVAMVLFTILTIVIIWRCT